MRDKIGSIWRKWDLHFHTPSSYDYSDSAVTNQEIVDGLVENNIEVVAITDHHTIDVERIEELKILGKNKIVILPGIEFLGELRGDEPIHFIAIFSENCDLQHIWGQLQNRTEIRKIRGEGKDPNQIYCDILDTSKIIRELGGLITIHAGKKHNGIENITHALPHALAQKEDIAKAIDIFEIGKLRDVVDYETHVIPYLVQTIEKRIPLIISSDNHNIKKYTVKQSLWIKGDPSFLTLKQLLNQPDRSFIGDRPQSLQTIENNQTKYIEKIYISKKSDVTFEETWFNKTEIFINPGLVAIIGNKGNGKSALTDIIGLCGNTHNHSGFSFLNVKKFRENKKKKADNFEATLTWKNGKTNTCSLSQEVDISQEERIKYIPQSYLEKLCASIEGGAFENELRNIIFSHIPQHERLGKNNLEELLNYKTIIIRNEIEKIKSEISIINAEILALEEKQNPSYLLKLEANLEIKEEELEAHELLKPIKQDPPGPVEGGNFEEINRQISILRAENDAINALIHKSNTEISQLNKNIETLSQRKQSLESLKGNLDSHQIESKNILKQFDLEIESIFNYYINTDPIENLIKIKNEKIVELEIIVSNNGEKNIRLKDIKDELIELQGKLDLPAKQYQEYLNNIEKWNAGEQEILGAPDIEGSMLNFRAQIDYVEEQLESDLNKKFLARSDLIKSVFEKKVELLNIYKNLYKSVTDFIANHDSLLDSYKISFDTLFRENELYIRFENFINFNSKGSFYGVNEGLGKLKELYESCNFSSADEAYSFVEKILENIKFDTRQSGHLFKEIKSQLKAGNTPLEFYNFVCELDYIIPVYDLKLSNKNVSTLSPGERGALLLIFYLVLDNNHIPLIIDQPEENLDNQSVYKILVPFIKMAKSHRQVIIVTHNPNLAVVCDADQIIYVRIDKDNKNEVFVQTGGLENPDISAKIVEILEGTYPAFYTRTNTYKASSIF